MIQLTKEFKFQGCTLICFFFFFFFLRLLGSLGGISTKKSCWFFKDSFKKSEFSNIGHTILWSRTTRKSPAYEPSSSLWWSTPVARPHCQSPSLELLASGDTFSVFPFFLAWVSCQTLVSTATLARWHLGPDNDEGSEIKVHEEVQENPK